MPADPASPSSWFRRVFLEPPRDYWDWLVVVTGYGISLVSFVATISQNDNYATLGPWILMIIGCAIGGSIGQIGLLAGRRMSGWIIPFVWALLYLWTPAPQPAEPQPPHVWGKTDVRSLAVLSRGRVALCGGSDELVIVDPSGNASLYPAPQFKSWCGGQIRASGDGFFSAAYSVSWSDGRGNHRFISLPEGAGKIVDVVMLPSGVIRVLGLVERITDVPIPGGTEGIVEDSTMQLIDVAPSGSSRVVARIPKLDQPNFSWWGGVLFEDGSAAIHQKKIYRVSPDGALDPNGIDACQPMAVHAVDPMSAYFFESKTCNDVDLWRIDAGRVTAIHLTPPRTRLDDVGSVIDARDQGFFVSGQFGLAHYDRSGGKVPFHIAPAADQIAWDGGGLITLERGTPRRYLLDGSVDEAFPWPTITTTQRASGPVVMVQR